MSTSQKVDVLCPQCKAKLAVPVAAMGKSGKCPHCQNVFPLAMPAPRAAAPAALVSPLTPLAPASPASPLSPLMPAYAAPALAPLGGADLMPLSDAGLSPLPAGNQFAPLGSSNPFAAPPPSDDYTLQPAAPSPYAPASYTPSMTLPSNSSIAAEHLAMANASYEESKQRKYYNNDGDGWGLNAGIGGGALLMLGAVVWFVVGLACGYIFFYPPIMFIIGLIAFFKGIADNFSD
ncbi:MAG TPA: hypothetical protein VMP01_02710 [Pirellulaceae bacterium]|nr:hypothetical protein [Pirellulaceae bacterium]